MLNYFKVWDCDVPSVAFEIFGHRSRIFKETFTAADAKYMIVLVRTHRRRLPPGGLVHISPSSSFIFFDVVRHSEEHQVFTVSLAGPTGQRQRICDLSGRGIL